MPFLLSSTVYQNLIKGRKREGAQFLALAVVLTLLQAPLPYLSGYMIDSVLPSRESGLLVRVTCLMAALYGAYLIVFYVNSRLVLRVRQEVMTELSERAMRGILGMSYNRRLELHSGDLVSRLTRDLGQLSFIMPYGWANLVYRVLLSAVLLTVVFVMNWQLSSFLVILVPAAILIYMRFDAALWSSSDAESRASAGKLAVIQETIEADAEVKAYEAERFFLEHSGRGVRNYEQKRFIRELYDTKVNIIITGMPMAAIVLIWYLGGSKVMSDEVSIGLVITYTSTLALIVPALVSILEFASSYPNEVTALQRVAQLFAPAEDGGAIENASTVAKGEAVESPRCTAPDGLCSAPPGAPPRSLAVSGLGFSYSPQYPLFKALDLDLRPDLAHLINGGNGAGKSTLLAILGGFLLPLEGHVLVDGRELATLPQRSRWITHLPQRVRIISDSIRNNVTLGLDYPAWQIEAALERVGLSKWIERLSDGIDHRIVNASSELSGGQIQKIGIARALLRETPILLMDEPTNNLDSQAVTSLIEIIRSYKKDRIIVIVSHDDRMFDAVDRVIYLESSMADESTRVTERSVSLDERAASQRRSTLGTEAAFVLGADAGSAEA